MEYIELSIKTEEFCAFVMTSLYARVMSLLISEAFGTRLPALSDQVLTGLGYRVGVPEYTVLQRPTEVKGIQLRDVSCVRRSQFNMSRLEASFDTPASERIQLLVPPLYQLSHPNNNEVIRIGTMLRPDRVANFSADTQELAVLVNLAVELFAYDSPESVANSTVSIPVSLRLALDWRPVRLDPDTSGSTSTELQVRLVFIGGVVGNISLGSVVWLLGQQISDPAYADIRAQNEMTLAQINAAINGLRRVLLRLSANVSSLLDGISIEKYFIPNGVAVLTEQGVIVRLQVANRRQWFLPEEFGPLEALPSVRRLDRQDVVDTWARFLTSPTPPTFAPTESAILQVSPGVYLGIAQTNIIHGFRSIQQDLDGALRRVNAHASASLVNEAVMPGLYQRSGNQYPFFDLRLRFTDLCPSPFGLADAVDIDADVRLAVALSSVPAETGPMSRLIPRRVEDLLLVLNVTVAPNAWDTFRCLLPLNLLFLIVAANVPVLLAVVTTAAAIAATVASDQLLSDLVPDISRDLRERGLPNTIALHASFPTIQISIRLIGFLNRIVEMLEGEGVGLSSILFPLGTGDEWGGLNPRVDLTPSADLRTAISLPNRGDVRLRMAAIERTFSSYGLQWRQQREAEGFAWVLPRGCRIVDDDGVLRVDVARYSVVVGNPISLPFPAVSVVRVTVEFTGLLDVSTTVVYHGIRTPLRAFQFPALLDSVSELRLEFEVSLASVSRAVALGGRRAMSVSVVTTLGSLSFQIDDPFRWLLSLLPLFRDPSMYARELDRLSDQCLLGRSPQGTMVATPMGRRAGLPSFGNPLEEYGRIRQGFYIPYEIVNPVDRTGGLAITALARTTMTVNELQEDANPHGIELVELALRAARLRE